MPGLYDDPMMGSGLFDAGMQGQANQQGLMALASGLLQASQPSTTPQSFGAAFGGAANQAMKARSQAANEVLRAKLISEQVASSKEERAEKERKRAAREKFSREVIPGLLDETGNLRPGGQSALAMGLFDMGETGAASTLLTKGGEGFTLGENQVRYGPGGTELARGPTADKPFSEVAKLQADLQGGRITPAQYQAALNKATRVEGGGGPFAGTGDAQYWNMITRGDPRTPEYAAAYWELFGKPRFVQTDKGFVPIQTPPPQGVRPPVGMTPPAASAPPPGANQGAPQPTAGPVIPGTERTEKPNPDLARREVTLSNLESALNLYEQLLTEKGPSKLGAVGITTADNAAVGSAYQNLLIEMKNLFELGALSGPDYDIMTKTIQDPNSLRGSVSLGAEGLKGQLNVIREKLASARRNLRSEYPNAKQDGGVQWQMGPDGVLRQAQ